LVSIHLYHKTDWQKKLLINVTKHGIVETRDIQRGQLLLENLEYIESRELWSLSSRSVGRFFDTVRAASKDDTANWNFKNEKDTY
jgi:hypothetical protein